MKTSDNPGVVIPPPMIFGFFFGLSILFQFLFPIEKAFFLSAVSRVIGFVMTGVCLVFDIPSLVQFFRTRNSLVTIHSANSLQTKGLYSVSRNPMYTGLLCLYTGLAFLIGNWWTIIFIPFLILFIQFYVIRREERYLERRFGEEFSAYRKRVRRWL